MKPAKLISERLLQGNRVIRHKLLLGAVLDKSF